MPRRCMARWQVGGSAYHEQCQERATHMAALALNSTSVIAHYCRSCWAVEFGNEEGEQQ